MKPGAVVEVCLVDGNSFVGYFDRFETYGDDAYILIKESKHTLFYRQILLSKNVTYNLL